MDSGVTGDIILPEIRSRYLGGYTFYGCTATLIHSHIDGPLTGTRMNSWPRNLEARVFSGCTNLETVTFGSEMRVKRSEKKHSGIRR